MSSASLYADRKTESPIHALVVGGGIGGLCTAYCLGKAGIQVTVVEGTHQTFSEIGAGLQLSPNVTRILHRWGLSERLEKITVKPNCMKFHRWSTGEVVGCAVFGDKIVKDYGFPYYYVHRADLFELLHNLAKPYTYFVLGSKVVSLYHSPESGVFVTLASGRTIAADLIIGADGIHSVVRSFVCGTDSHTISTGDAAFRATLPADLLLENPNLRELVLASDAHSWMGPGKHMIGYPLRSGKIFNIVMTYPDTKAKYSWLEPGDPNVLRSEYEGWEPRVNDLLALVDNTLTTKLTVVDPLTTWVHLNSGLVALLGDSAHPMLPYRAQGAAMAIEDAAVLGNLFSRIKSRMQIPSFLHAYQELRYQRATATQLSSKDNQVVFHLPDGPEQEARDAAMKEAMSHSLDENKGNPNVWADATKNAKQFGYDADEAVETWWSEYGSSIEIIQ